jgi:hypothetical protein
MIKKYQIDSPSLAVEDKESVSFHVKSADYFGTIATIISLWKQNNKIPDKDFKDLLGDLRDLQENYIIKKKSR